jgi:hypothetical protein
LANSHGPVGNQPRTNRHIATDQLSPDNIDFVPVQKPVLDQKPVQEDIVQVAEQECSNSCPTLSQRIKDWNQSNPDTSLPEEILEAIQQELQAQEAPQPA